MSKSVGNVIDPFALCDAYGVDPLRYFFLREVPFGQDGNYSHEAIVNRINADLANDLGNLAQRSLSMIGKAFGGVLPEPGEFTRRRQDDPGRRRRHDRHRARAHEDAAAAPGAQRGLGGGGRRQPLFRRREAPWAKAKTDPQAAGDDPLRDGRGAAAGRHPGAALRAGFGGEAARSAGDSGRANATSPRSTAAAASRPAPRCRRRRRCSRAMSSPKQRPENAGRQPLPSRFSRFRQPSSTPWWRARARPASAAW